MAVDRRFWPCALLLMVVLGLSWQRVAAASQVLATCDDCPPSQHNSCATQMGHQFWLAHGSHVWIVDFVQQYATKFKLEVYPPDTIIYGAQEAPVGRCRLLSDY